MNGPDMGNDDYYDDEESFRPNKGERKGWTRRSRRETKHYLKDYLYDGTDVFYDTDTETEEEDTDNDK